MRLRTFVVVSLVVMGAWVGCGGSASTDLTAGGSADGGGANATTGDGAAGNGSNTNLTPGGPDGGVNPADAGPGGNTAALKCGATACAIPAQVCCISRGNGGSTTYSCATGSCPSIDAGAGGGGGGGGGGNNGNTASLKCSDTANCSTGSVCCAQRTQTGVVSVCKATCTANEAQLCDPTATPTGCAAAAPCSTQNITDFGLPAGYATCGGIGG